MRGRQQIAGIGEAVGRGFGAATVSGVDPELGEIAAVQCLLDRDRLDRAIGRSHCTVAASGALAAAIASTRAYSPR